MENKKTWGGKRENSGRKPEGKEKKYMLTVTVKKENLDFLNENVENKSRFIDNLLDLERNKKKKK